ncbi:MAG TPA: hypothetical protein PLG92_08140 [Piscinibacter sp.]|jgi:hypothetical protein|uniref:hypothetical protein n=1 Tax=Piscinibacter sp. TaxID=1903157 RepID=UPI001B5DED55|nr:hypothetical protein [Piscinibacter sp.]MBP5991915.1 hypothetical protein [Piscinibacter sp.]MBP6029394.1 hypothetical protein [Piscinibacter sp.]HNK18324.1 hypothetical protein [Piscinibacter sp.]
MATPPRLKAHWFKPEQARNPAQTGSAIAFIAWRVGSHVIKRLREAGFDIDAGPAYFGVLRELLVFLLAGADRIAYARLGGEGRTPFTRALVLRAAEILDENESDLLGALEGGASYAERFLEQFNLLSGHYAEFGWSEAEGPDFAFVRYLGHRLEPLLPEKDRRWVLDQVMAVEVPEAVGMLQRSMDGVFSSEPRRARRESMSGE